MEVKLVESNKKAFLDLLLLADEQESMIDNYLYRGDLFTLYDGDLKSVCVVTNEGDGNFEIQNLATYEEYQRQGYGCYLIDYVCRYYKNDADVMIVGTGDSQLTVPFYEKCGFTVSHRIKNYMIEHYDHPIFENGVQLFDKVYLKRVLRTE